MHVAKQHGGHKAGISAATITWPRCQALWPRVDAPHACSRWRICYHISTGFENCDGSRRQQQTDHQRFFATVNPCYFVMKDRDRRRRGSAAACCKSGGCTGTQARERCHKRVVMLLIMDWMCVSFSGDKRGEVRERGGGCIATCLRTCFLIFLVSFNLFRIVSI